MKILSVNVATPKKYHFQNTTLETSMWKLSQDSIEIKKNNLIGDEFKSPNVHGTPDAIVYALGANCYNFWRQKTNNTIPFGKFGENLTLDYLDEATIFIGDDFQCGTARIKATGVRFPCNKLNFVFQDPDMRNNFLYSNNPGVYFEVTQPSVVYPNESLILYERAQSEISTFSLYHALRSAELKKLNQQTAEDLLSRPFILEKYKTKLRKSLISESQN